MQCPFCGSQLPDTAQVCSVCGSSLAPQTLPVGTVLNGKYRVDRVLGQGGFGITYAATQLLLGSQVAIKEMFLSGTVRQGSTIHPPTGINSADWNRARDSFIEEARVLARFNHPDIVRVLDLFEEGGTAYMVMERLEVETLQDVLNRQGTLPAADVHDIALRVARALQVVHGAGLLHRDIKPDNIFLDPTGRIILIDFGSARAFESGKTVQHTRMVTPGYAPMEQYGSSMKFGPYTDIYALGATLYHALSGKMPPPAPDLLQGTPLPPLPVATPADLRRVVEWSMSPKVSDRPQQVADLIKLLAPTAGPTQAPPSPRPPTPSVPKPQPTAPVPPPSPVPVPRRNATIWPILLLLVVGFGAFKAFSGAGKTTQPPAETTTAQENADASSPAAAQDGSSTDNSGTETSDSATNTDTASPEATNTQAITQPLTMTSPQPYATLPPGSFDLRGSGQPGEVIEIAEDSTRLGRIQISEDGTWSFSVPGPSVGPHTYELSDSAGNSQGSLSINIARPEAKVTPAESVALPISDEEVQQFVDRYLESGGGTNLTEAMNLYAEQVDYFGRGVQPKSALYNDKLGYFKRWPTRTYRRTTDITTLSRQGDSLKVRFDYRYDISNPNKEVSGTAYTVLNLKRIAGELKITGENGDIYPETQTKRNLIPPTSENASAAAGAPTFVSWHFEECHDEETGEWQTELSRGRLQDCRLVIETVPNGSKPVSAVFNYELEYYDASGQIQKFAINVPDHWPPVPDQPTTAFEQDGNNLIFTLPLIVKDRPDRQYTSINATGTITFDNGSRKNVYEKLAVR